MNVDEFLDAVEVEGMTIGSSVSIESVRRVFEREFPNGAKDAGLVETLEEEFSAAPRQRDRQMFWEAVYAAAVSRGGCGHQDPAGEADYALSEWDKRWEISEDNWDLETEFDVKGGGTVRHEWREGATYLWCDHYNGVTRGNGQWGDLEREILRLAPQSVELALFKSILETEGMVAGTADGLRKLILDRDSAQADRWRVGEERDAAQTALDEANEIQGEVTAALAMLLKEPLTPCLSAVCTCGHRESDHRDGGLCDLCMPTGDATGSRSGCQQFFPRRGDCTGHLGPKAHEAINEARAAWMEQERKIGEQAAEIERLKAEVAELRLHFEEYCHD